jgi:hypothetical protein
MKQQREAIYLAAAAVTLAAAFALGVHGARADQPATQPPQTDVQVIALQPSIDAIVPSTRPGFSGEFGVPIDANSVRFLIDGQDVSMTAYVSRTDFMFSAPFDLAPQRHTAEITGKAMNGAGFDKSWSFGSSASGSAVNFVNDLSPAPGSLVGASFTVTGSTLPNSRVRVAASPTLAPSGALAAGDATFTIDATAGADGRFAAPVQMAAPGPVTVRVVSIDPATNAGASATISLHD